MAPALISPCLLFWRPERGISLSRIGARCPAFAACRAATVAVLHGVSTPEEAAYAIATGVRPVLNSAHQIGVWRSAGGGPCHVMIDSGMNRLGCALQDVAAAQIDDLEIKVLLSHLASADEETDQNARQLSVFREARAAINAAQYSLANSAGIALGAEYHFNLTRPGLALYGGVTGRHYPATIAQVVFPQAAVLQMRDLNPGDQVGYNAQFTAPRPMRVATVSLGYADGFLRSWGGRAHCSIRARIAAPAGPRFDGYGGGRLHGAPGLREGDFLDISV